MNLVFKRFFEGLSWRDNIYWVLVLRLLLMMALFTICRLGFYFFNLQFFQEITFRAMLRLLWGGLVFDLSTVLYVNLLYITLMIVPLKIRFNYYYRISLKYLFFITNGIALAANVSDFIYYRFTLRRTTADVFTQFQNETNMGGLWLKFFIDYWYAALFWVLLVVVMIFVFNLIRYKGPQLRSNRSFYITGVLAVPVIAYLMIGGMRGGFRHSTRPITLSNAGEYVEDPKHISVVLNTPFAIIRTVGKTKVQKVHYYSEEEVENIYSPVHYPGDTGNFIARNVVVIILESFSKEFIGAFNREKHNGTYRGYTPFLDSLIGHSRTFEYSFANGRKSIDGLPSVVSSIPSLGTPYFLSPYSGNSINSFASLLRRKGYHTSFFHGAPNGSMGFQAFMNIAGVEAYYGMNEYNNDRDFDGLWGIWDDKFLQFYAERLNEFREPFFSSFFSVSSHHPFKVPAEYRDKFKGGPLVIHKCIEYTDYSLRKFFEKVSSMPWYDNTLFVITADHTSSEIEFPETRTAWGFYSVPIIFFTPDHSLTGVEDRITQQIDILPTVLNYLHYDEPYVAFGRDAFSADGDHVAFNFKDNNYQLFSGDYLLQFNGSETSALYNFRNDKLLLENKARELPEVVGELEKKIKAIIQQYNNRLVEDRMTVRNQ
jgi:phosphoglycerol transferase MdoB-like AlkP superfamily enzyme